MPQPTGLCGLSQTDHDSDHVMFGARKKHEVVHIASELTPTTKVAIWAMKSNLEQMCSSSLSTSPSAAPVYAKLKLDWKSADVPQRVAIAESTRN